MITTKHGCDKYEHTLQFHVVWAVGVDHSEQRSSVANVPHQILQKWEKGQLTA